MEKKFRWKNQAIKTFKLWFLSELSFNLSKTKQNKVNIWFYLLQFTMKSVYINKTQTKRMQYTRMRFTTGALYWFITWSLHNIHLPWELTKNDKIYYIKLFVFTCLRAWGLWLFIRWGFLRNVPFWGFFKRVFNYWGVVWNFFIMV